jgi:hypothetical protein
MIMADIFTVAAFCAHLAFVAPEQDTCFFAISPHPVSSVEDCLLTAEHMREDASLQRHVAVTLNDLVPDNNGNVAWTTYCIRPEQIPAFQKYHGVKANGVGKDVNAEVEYKT